MGAALGWPVTGCRVDMKQCLKGTGSLMVEYKKQGIV